MDLTRKLELLDEQIATARDGHPANFREWKDRTDVVLRLVMGENHSSVGKFHKTQYSPQMYTVGTDFAPYRAAGVLRVVSLLKACKDELQLRLELEDAVELPAEESAEAKQLAVEQGRVFIVHGHNNELKLDVARFLAEALGQQPVILHEQANRGRNMFRKFADNAATAGFAVSLLTSDDVGGVSGSDTASLHARARQNVVFETGYFAGALGMDRMAVLYEEGVAWPSDVEGLAYIPVDAAGAWKADLLRELEAAGYTVKWDALGRA